MGSVERVMEVFGRTALEVCEGQQWDMEFEHRLDVTVDELHTFHNRKSA